MGREVNSGEGDGGMATAAKFADFSGLAFDNTSNLYVMDYSPPSGGDYSVIQKIDVSTGTISAINSCCGGYSGDNGLILTPVLLTLLQ